MCRDRTTGPETPTLDLEAAEDRYSRLRLIPWWNEAVLGQSKVVVVGAGALGNEIIKDLTLLGVGAILIVDDDTVETSNLSRSVLYRERDAGQPKARTAARAARELNPDCAAFALVADVTSGVGAGVYRWADVVICGLDNHDARLAVNRSCWSVGTPWVDGATESLAGVARTFIPPEGPCFECTLGELDSKLIGARNSCGFLARAAHRHGGAPTTPTTSAVIAGIQVQEAVKLLHGRGELAGRGFFFDGASYDCFTIDYVRREDCLSHETWSNIVTTELRSDTAALSDIVAEAERVLGAGAVVDLPAEMVTRLRCRACGSEREFFRLLTAIDEREARCGKCGHVETPEVVTQCRGDEPFAALSLEDVGFALMEIVSARLGDQETHIEVSGDAARLFGSARD